jgi:decaprenylphospho-beta-D-ribofuranose 2-oxidase
MPAPALQAPATAERLLTGWGRTAPTRALVQAAETIEQVQDAVGRASHRGVLARGLGRSYGDAAQNAGGVVIDMRGLDHIGHIDPDAGTVEVEAGATIAQLIRAGMRHGWFVPVTPGTAEVTVGGAIAADVHGKNHHRDSSICRHVLALRLVTPDGEQHTLEPADPLFAATAGGMGLTGVIVRATLRLVRVESSRMRVDTDRTDGLERAMGLMVEGDHRYGHSVAWIDLAGGGARPGRCVLQRGNHARAGGLPAPDRALALPRRRSLRAPRWAPAGLLRPATVRAFNELWYRMAPRARRGELMELDGFFHPLDRVAGWNRVYGRPGLVQYQLCLPTGREGELLDIVARLAARRCPVALGVLKRFGEASGGLLSFPLPGWTLAADIPAAWPGLAALLDELDEVVTGAGGRVYLAKDSRLSPQRLEAMYPLLREWRAVRRQVDPEGVMRSDLARRLGL